MFVLQELRKTLSVVKIEKEDMEAALSESRKEFQALEQKNKVMETDIFAQLLKVWISLRKNLFQQRRDKNVTWNYKITFPNVSGLCHYI